MSRVGNVPIAIPSGVTVTATNGEIKVKGPKGELAHRAPEPISVEVQENEVRVTRSSDARQEKALHGLTRALIANMVHGVTQGFEKKLEIHGVGYRAAVQGEILQLEVGLSHMIRFPIPKGIEVAVDRAVTVGGQPMTPVTLKGINNILVGDTAAKIRSLRPPEPYQGKGIRYADERVRRKVGKKAS